VVKVLAVVMYGFPLNILGTKTSLNK